MFLPVPRVGILNELHIADLHSIGLESIYKVYVEYTQYNEK